MPMTKSEIKTYSEKVIEEVKNGQIDPIKLAVYLKSIEETLKIIKENHDVKFIIQDEAEKYGKKFEMWGSEIQNSSRTTYDYSECGDQVYNDLKAQEMQLKEVIKAREAMIKSGVNPETGETFAPPKSSTTTFLTIKFK